jgi:hypothetical protein
MLSSLCKLRKDCLAGTGQGATVFVVDFSIVNEILWRTI